MCCSMLSLTFWNEIPKTWEKMYSQRSNLWKCFFFARKAVYRYTVDLLQPTNHMTLSLFQLVGYWCKLVVQFALFQSQILLRVLAF
jgi:hypothetical protein